MVQTETHFIRQHKEHCGQICSINQHMSVHYGKTNIPATTLIRLAFQSTSKVPMQQLIGALGTSYSQKLTLSLHQHVNMVWMLVLGKSIGLRTC